MIAQIEGTVTRHWEVTAVSIRLVDGSTWPGMLRRRPNKRQKAPSFMVTKVQPAGFYLINAPSSTFCFFLGCSTNYPERAVDLLVVWSRLKGV